MLKEIVTISPAGLILLCMTMCGIGACIAHWVDVRWPDGPEDARDGDRQ